MGESPTATHRRHPYDVLPYESSPIEWTAPERLALVSRLHGGPRITLRGLRYLELGCGNGANLIPLAYYRRHSHFVGLDAAPETCRRAVEQASSLGLTNLQIVEEDLDEGGRLLDGKFDVILGHGIFSWIPEHTRGRLLDLCAQRLAPGGLLYLSYNARPGWDVRGLVRAYLMEHTAREATGTRARAELAQRIAASLAPVMLAAEHPFSQLMGNELELVRDALPGYVGHDYLAEYNRPFWRREFLDLMRCRGFVHVADADFNYSSGRLPDDIESRVEALGLPETAVADTVDLLYYRQFHCPVLAHAPLTRRPLDFCEFSRMYVAACLTPPAADAGPGSTFKHPSGYEVEAREQPLRGALERVCGLWPRGVRVASLFDEPDLVREDLLLLQRNGLIDLRCVEPDLGIDPLPLRTLETATGEYYTTPYHTREGVGSSRE